MFPSNADAVLKMTNDTVLCRRYRILGTLRERGRETSYLAHDAFIGSRVVLEVYDVDLPPLDVQAWKRQARVLQGLRHPAIAEYTDYFEHGDGGLVLVRTHVEGETLGDRLQRGESFSLERVKHIAEQVSDALIYVHGQKPPVYHGAIEPHNLVLDSKDRVHLVGFACAHETGEMGGASSAWGDRLPGQVLDQEGPSRDLNALSATLLRAQAVRREELAVPEGSAFQAYAEPERLQVIIPGTGFFKGRSRGIGSFAFLWSVLSGLFPLVILMAEGFDMVGIAAGLAFWATSIPIVRFAAFVMVGTTVIEVAATEVRVVRTLGNRSKETRGSLRSWKDAQVLSIDDDSFLMYECVLFVGSHRVSIGRHLSQPDLHWIARVLNDEVRRLRDA